MMIMPMTIICTNPRRGPEKKACGKRGETFVRVRILGLQSSPTQVAKVLAVDDIPCPPGWGHPEIRAHNQDMFRCPECNGVKVCEHVNENNERDCGNTIPSTAANTLCADHRSVIVTG